MPTMATLSTLPAELYTHILSFVPPSQSSSTTLSLTRAIPRSPVPQHNLFTHVVLTKKGQLLQLYLRLTRGKGEEEKERRERERRWVKGFELREWKFDPDVLINTVLILPRLQTLTIWIGYNCAPEHIAEIFLSRSFPELESISLRFRTWTDHANYLPFLKGSYYDSTFDAIARSPPPRLKHFSVQQDVPTPELFDHPDDEGTAASRKREEEAKKPFLLSPALRRNFAPPIVLFATTCLTHLTGASSIHTSLRSLRLRFPQRPILQHLSPLPNLAALDLSTSTLTPADLRFVFIKFPRLQTLVLDHTAYFIACGKDGAAEEMREAGRVCAMWGVGRARDVEKEAKDWWAAEMAKQARTRDEDEDAPSDVDPPLPVPGTAPDTGLRKTPKKGRRGIATATISLRDRPAASTSSTVSQPRITPGQIQTKFHVLPPLPSLQSIALGVTDRAITPALRATWASQFAQGWLEGRRRLIDFCRRYKPTPSSRVFFLPAERAHLPIPYCLEEVRAEEAWQAYVDKAASIGEEGPGMCSVPDQGTGVPARRGFGGGRKSKRAVTPLAEGEAVPGSSTAVPEHAIEPEEAEDEDQLVEEGHSKGCAHQM
ncbi:hypothetical protein DACRYDRAFT_117737 [Dacryopinax primogenitus]|uniref:F-box domain-containing protein n=1 Tax=Dacryopinax primogenitus (strain DJM 731) TaxID=1858805 RepID=M5G6W4_DACPD|nr:uncharacterized protein DACRYDRAFT_117737 [Dacryopinax primogenitus]EJT99497.1 hypothetical protein DACRYDRAFT_117737 [Dacryopinax primogenitus]